MLLACPHTGIWSQAKYSTLVLMLAPLCSSATMAAVVIMSPWNQAAYPTLASYAYPPWH
jgi:hypothetical protein